MNTLIFLVLILIVLSAFFSGSEIAYASASKPRLVSEAEDGNKKAKKALGIVDNYVRAIATILVGNSLVNIAATSVITLLFVEYFLPNRADSTVFAEVFSTVILLIFGEFLPKILFSEYANRLVLSLSGPLSAAMTVFRPVTFVVSKFVEKISVLWAREESEQAMTDEELSMVVDSIQEEGVFSESEGELIKSAIEFGGVTAHDILIPRVDVAAYDIETPLADLLADPEIMTYSRLPVYRESIDNIIGILPMKQLVKAVLTQGIDKVDVESMLVQPLFVHMTKNINEILKDFRKEKTNMAVVLDEYGGTMGILTTEDILEEIVGEIYDETDEVEAEEVKEVTEGIYLMDGSMNIYDVFDEIGWEPKDFESEYTTLSGWITELLDHFPEVGDSFEYERISGTVVSVDGRLVEQAEIRVKPEDKEE